MRRRLFLVLGVFCCISLLIVLAIGWTQREGQVAEGKAAPKHGASTEQASPEATASRDSAAPVALRPRQDAIYLEQIEERYLQVLEMREQSDFLFSPAALLQQGLADEKRPLYPPE